MTYNKNNIHSDPVWSDHIPAPGDGRDIYTDYRNNTLTIVPVRASSQVDVNDEKPLAFEIRSLHHRYL
jgi:hypothetical protein